MKPSTEMAGVMVGTAAMVAVTSVFAQSNHLLLMTGLGAAAGFVVFIAYDLNSTLNHRTHTEDRLSDLEARLRRLESR